MSFGMVGSALGAEPKKLVFSEISSISDTMPGFAYMAQAQAHTQLCATTNLNNIYASAPKLSLTLTSGNNSQIQQQIKEEEFESKSGSDNVDENVSADEQDDHQRPRKKRYHRHTPQQIQEMEALFKECPHPDEKQRMALSKKLGLAPMQIKFWFQNRRTQMKNQFERHENTILKQENEKLKLQNLTMREAIRNPVCANCRGPAILAQLSVHEHHLRLENTRLKEELQRAFAITEKIGGRTSSIVTPVVALPPHHDDDACAAIAGGNQAMNASAAPLNFTCDFLQGFSVPPANARGHEIPLGIDRPLAEELALQGMGKLLKICQVQDNGAFLNLEDHHLRVFPRVMKQISYGADFTCHSENISMTAEELVEILMDQNRFGEMFVGIVSKVVTLDVLCGGTNGSRHTALQLMYMELQVPSPLVAPRKLYFLRFSQLQAQDVWAVVDVSIDVAENNTTQKPRRHPSGCIIQQLSDGFSKVTWVENWDYDARGVQEVHRGLVNSVVAFGAQGWLATLQRQSERLAIFMDSRPGDPNAAGRRSLMKLSERMTLDFFSAVNASATCPVDCEDENNNVVVKTRVGEISSGFVLSACTSVWLPVLSQRLFFFLRDEAQRYKWDILSSFAMKEEEHISKGKDPGNYITVLSGDANQNVILQECSTDARSSSVIYAAVNSAEMKLVMRGGDSCCVPVVPSGFVIVPISDQKANESRKNAVVSEGGGSLLTVAFQLFMPTVSSSSSEVDRATVKQLISQTIEAIKSAMDCCKDA